MVTKQTKKLRDHIKIIFKKSWSYFVQNCIILNLVQTIGHLLGALFLEHQKILQPQKSRRQEGFLIFNFFLKIKQLKLSSLRMEKKIMGINHFAENHFVKSHKVD
jgi:hypothetical protein